MHPDNEDSTTVFRADRFATLFVFRPLQRLRTAGTRIPILMYHSISELDDSKRHPYYRTATAPRIFDRHLKFLNDNGYRTTSLSNAVRCLRGPGGDAKKTVVITFDDGFQDFYTNAFPALSRYGFSATMFLPTAYIDRDARKFNGVECLTWSQVRELQNAGMQFGSHTVTHPQLKNLDLKNLDDEIRCSKQRIEEELGCGVASFSYPYAFPETDTAFQQQLGGLLQEHGYENGVSTIIGTADRADSRFFMKRLPVNSCDDVALFGAKLEGGYDWLHALQYASKLVTPGH
jgi:peptidoglycan/xylan/chitin deacetylase (PgdA/CDA1 family)